MHLVAKDDFLAKLEFFSKCSEAHSANKRQSMVINFDPWVS